MITRPGEVLEPGTVILRDGLIESVGGAQLAVPPDARVWDLRGMNVYPGFIDAFASIGEAKKGWSANSGQHWNASVHPERRALETVALDDEDFEERRALGFTSAHVVPQASGVFLGQGALVQLTSANDAGRTLNPSVAQHLAFDTTSDAYPKSLMGCLALIRQTFSDARWHFRYRQAHRKDPHTVRPGENDALRALESLVARRRQPAFFQLGNEADSARALSVADAYRIKRILVDPGYAYRQWELFKRKQNRVVLSVDFPDVPDVEDPDSALDVSLERLQHWELAPSNPALLQNRGIAFALSTEGLSEELDHFWPNIRRAIRHGLKEAVALDALTRVPAEMLGEAERLGEIGPGRIANLVVTSGNPFLSDESKVRQVWIDGKPWLDELDRTGGGARGRWELAWTGVTGPEAFLVSGNDTKLRLTLPGDESASAPGEEEKDSSSATIEQLGDDVLRLTLPETVFGGEKGGTSPVRLSAYLNAKTMVGQGVLPDGRRFSWSARRAGDPVPEASKQPKTPEVTGEFEQYPAGAYPGKGGASPDEKGPKRLLIENATVWTCGPAGILQEADLLIENGKVAAVGRDLEVPKNKKKVTKIDGSGKHITPGLVDCHSHTAISRGVNEGSHAVTCEVRIGDVVDPTDISIYRQLAGGLTTANLLHGSANPMGGQNQVIKLRWGSDAEGLKFEGAKPGVKFALGENVKQSNWGDDFTTRYPQTRMGVEQLMRDTFLAAREYGDRKRRHEERSPALPFREDFRLEAVLEILRGERIVHIHSYRQDEILMFVRLAQEFGFTVGTFQHVLEGYKIASHLREIDAGASSFSDWWAYKFEVYDAIPHNGALLHRAGVLTSFNSDDNELATRLNTEAAKAVKYGGVSPEEALKFVTINPAIQLRVAHRVGSLEVGKDADFVLWSGPPLSTLSRCEQTWIEGRRYFDLASDGERRAWVASERRRLIAKVLAAPKKQKTDKDSDGREADDDDGAVLSALDRMRLLSPWGQYELIDHQELYHDGQSLHACTGCYCDFR